MEVQVPVLAIKISCSVCRNTGKMVVMGHQLEKLVGSLKAKLKSLKGKKPYDKMGKTDSMRVEIRSKRAQKFIAKNLKTADSMGKKSYAF
ncbi:unnamed protein product [Musa acuminata subsp. malaccensis]|uniref:(wild Malaysian banana) hypothetical protein n=1 Tax=Musa acuminata subsp. malaccensis TaxID=214687 RepID=A0A804IAH1_MUSAM|nr:unnamed protein product [Musa acuminata subsp. malaccensis]